MPQNKVSFSYDYTAASSTLHVEVLGDTPAEIIDTLTKITEGLNANVPWKAKTNIVEVAKSVTKADVKKDPSLEDAYARDEALKLLVKVYDNMSLRDDAKALLPKYDIKKFGDIPLDRAKELLEDAKVLSKKLEAA